MSPTSWEPIPNGSALAAAPWQVGMRPERRSRKRALEDGGREVETEVGDLGKLSTWIEPRHGDPWSLADEDNCLDCCVPCLARLIDALETLSIGQMLLLLACLCAAFMALAAGIVSYSYAHLTPANEPLWPVSFEAVVEATGGLFVNGNCWVPRGATSCAPQFLLSGSSPSHVALLQGLLNDHGDVVPSMGGSAVTVMAGDGQARGESVPRAGLFAEDFFDAYLEDYGQEALTLHYMSMFEEITPPCPVLRTPYPLHLGKVTGEAHARYLRDFDAAKRASAVLPSAKVLFILAHPADDMFDRLAKHMGWRSHESDYDYDDENMDEEVEEEEEGEGTVGGRRHRQESIAASELFRDCFEAQMTWLRMCGLDSWISLPKMRWDTHGLQCYAETTNEVRFEAECVNDPLCLPLELEGKCPAGLVLGSVYGVMVQQYLRAFSLPSVHVLPLEDLLREPQKAMDSVTAFLGIEQTPLPPSSIATVNLYRERYRSRPRLRSSTRSILREYFMPFERSLEVIMKLPRGLLWGV